MGEALKLEDLVPNAQLGHYVIMEHIADGGMGHVYKAFEPTLQREVAIKILKPELAANSAQIDFFEEEAKNIASLRHPNIVPIHYIGKSGTLTYFAMAYVDGHATLDNWIDANSPLTQDDALWVLKQAIEALDWAFKSSIIHLDIKPSNFLVDSNGAILLTDFGLARSISSKNPSASTEDCYGTPAYMSPEQILKNPADQRSDIYSLGATLYHLLTMHFLHDGDTVENILLAHIKAPFPYDQAKAAGLSQGWINLLDRMTQKNPVDRFQNYDEIRNALKNVELIAPPSAAKEAELTARFQAVPHHGSEKKEELYGLLAKSSTTWAAAGIDSSFKKTKSQILELITKPMKPLAMNTFTQAILELQEGTTSDPAELADALSLMPDVETYVLGLARTRLCNPDQSEITSPKEAFSHVSPHLVHEILLTSVILKNDPPQSKEFNWKPLLQHSINVGVIASLLIDYLDKEEERSFAKIISNVKKSKIKRLAYFAGLTHDIGLMVLGEVSPYPVYATMRLAADSLKPLPLVEKEMLGTDHAETGEEWASHYAFDGAIKEVMRDHHNVSQKSSRLCALVTIANLLANRYGLGYSGNPVEETSLPYASTAWDVLLKGSSRPNLTPQEFEKEFAQPTAEIPLPRLGS